ncbi:MAG: NADH:ubiquinone reductase (Na(+)-transporting) subunit B [Planctomycetota bacterium]|nr:NADH:ubiquinone reductase (Na(+)-transporting) subunit B [Planctomycetota bacterium]
MKFLRKALDKIGKPFHKGGKWEKFYPLYEAADSFLYTPGTRTTSGPHLRDGNDLKRTMITVVIALLPCTLFALFNTGWQAMLADSAHADAVAGGISFGSLMTALGIGAWAFLPVYAVTIAVGGAIESVFATVRKHEINEGFLVTSLLFPLIMPPTIPLWQVAIGIAFGTLIGKEIFGGTGMNVLNPALTGRIFLFFAYPGQISGGVWRMLPSDAGQVVDGMSGATVLGAYAEGVAYDAAGLSWSDAFLGFMPGSMGETSALCCLIGAIVLIVTRVGSWRVMAGCVIGLVATVLLMNALAVNSFMEVPWHWHLVVGGFAFGAVFMATDPVSAAQTDTGRWIYGILIGALTVVVRVLNPAYPEGVMMAIVFMNVFAPTIDHYVTKTNMKRRARRLELQ